MLLRRFMKHVSDQNWFAVGLDVLVVITGIFIGLQVTDWSQAQKDKDLELVYIKRLALDFSENVRTLEQLAEFHAELRQDVNRVASFLALDEWDEDAHDAIRKQRLLWGALPFADLQSGAWDELVASGRLVLIQDDKLRSQLQQAHASNAAAAVQFTKLHDDIAITNRHFNDFMTLRKAEDGELFLTPNFRPVFGDQDIIKDLLFTASVQARAMGIRRGQVEFNQHVLNELNCIIDHALCRAGTTGTAPAPATNRPL